MYINKIFRGSGADDPTKRVEIETVPTVSNPTINPEPVVEQFDTCAKIRVVTKKAAETYPL
jgi:hypothetical protein